MQKFKRGSLHCTSSFDFHLCSALAGSKTKLNHPLLLLIFFAVPQRAQWLMKAESLMMMRGCLMRPRGGDLEDHLLPVRSNL